MKIITSFSTYRNMLHFHLCCFSSPTTSGSHWTSHQTAASSATEMEIGRSDTKQCFFGQAQSKELRAKWSCTVRNLASQLLVEVWYYTHSMTVTVVSLKYLNANRMGQCQNLRLHFHDLTFLSVLWRIPETPHNKRSAYIFKTTSQYQISSGFCQITSCLSQSQSLSPSQWRLTVTHQ